MTSDRKRATSEFNVYYVSDSISFFLFQSLQLVRLTDRRGTFYENKDKLFD